MRVSIATSFVCVSFALLAAACWLARPADAFVPNRWLLYVLRASHLDFSSSTTHKEMSRNAILQCAVELLKDHPHDPQSTQRIMAIGAEFDEEDLITAYHGERRRECTEEFEDAIETIEDANEDVDLGEEETVAAAHFDSEAFQSGQNRLVQLRENVVTNIRNRNFQMARRETGRLFHSLQDFYSHSNWIEMGNREPYSVLGQPGERPENIASPNTPTCINCNTDRRVQLGLILKTFAKYHYRCSNNIRSDILNRRLLTTGYYSDSRNSAGDKIEKPDGKCSHGGYIDSSGDRHATGGINKDSPFEDFSPHSSLHLDAARVAQQATVNLLNKIRLEVYDDRLFGAYLNLDVGLLIAAKGIVSAGSIAYVIDATGSMVDKLSVIQASIPALRSSLQQYSDNLGYNAQITYILVSFYNPGCQDQSSLLPDTAREGETRTKDCHMYMDTDQLDDRGEILKTYDIEVFLDGIASLTASGSGDAPKTSIGALIRAIKASDEGSPIFLFTDAPASDSHRLSEAQALIAEKSVTVTFALVDPLNGKQSVNDGKQLEGGIVAKSEQGRQNEEAYKSLASLSGGQVLHLQASELFRFGELVGFSAVESRNTILRVSGVADTPILQTFFVDSSIEEVILSINRERLSVSITTPAGTPASFLEQYSVSLQSATSLIATLTINESSLWGAWQISLHGYGSYNILVSALSDLSFSSELFAAGLSSSAFGFSAVVGKHLKGQLLIAAFQASDDDASLTVDAINVVDPEGTVLQSIDDVVSLGDNMFVGNFTPPAVSTFHWQISGKDEEGYSFSRISDTAIEVSDIELMLGERETGYYVLRPGEQATIAITLYNSGNERQFKLNIETSTSGGGSDISEFIEYFFRSDTITVDSNSMSEFTVQLLVLENAVDGLASTFLVVAQSVLGDSSDYVPFQLTLSTRPLPEFTENDYVTLSSTPELCVSTRLLWLAVLGAVWEIFVMLH